MNSQNWVNREQKFKAMIKVPLDHVTENQRKQTFIKVTEEMKLMRRTKHKRRKGAGGHGSKEVVLMVQIDRYETHEQKP